MRVKRTMRKQRTPGEAYVWLTSMGLAVGLCMILFLLGLVLIKGLAPFWPRPIMQLRLAPVEGGAAGEVLGGELVSKQEKLTQRMVAPAEVDVDTREVEWQLFTGNKDVYGLAFRYLDSERIESVEYPNDAIRIERMEYGPAIGIPVAVLHAEHGRIAFEEERFLETLNGLVEEVRERREEIKAIEKEEIGAINKRMSQVRLRENRLEQQPNPGEEVRAELELLNRQRQALEQQYQALADKAQELREKQSEHQFAYQLFTGEEQSVPLGQIVRFYFPNQMTFVDRVGWLARSLGRFLSEEPREANTEGGVFPAIFGTFVMTILMSVAVTPFGIMGAIYLREYAKQGLFVRAVRIAVNNLAGVPSIVFGVFGLGFFVYFVGGTVDSLFFSEKLPTPTFGTGGLLWASLTLALMTVPVVTVATEEALAAVSRGVREASLACGASKWQTIQHIVLPAAVPGILTGVILAMARGAGEVAPLMLVGVVKLAPELPLNLEPPFLHLDQKFMHLGFHIFDLGFQSPDSEAAKPMVFATTLVLLALVVGLNLAAILIRERLRRKYAVSAF